MVSSKSAGALAFSNWADSINMTSCAGKVEMSEAKKELPPTDEDIRATVVNGKTVAEWDQEWVPLKGGFGVLHSEYRRDAGLYKASLNGVVVALGKGTEIKNGGLRKRLSDFYRKSFSARNYKAGNAIHANLGQMTGEVLIVGSDNEAIECTEKLKKLMVNLHKPTANVPPEIVSSIITNSYKS